MKKILFFLFLHLSYLSFSQIGISTTTPRGILDLNITTTNTFGLVLPTNESTTNMLNPQGGNIAPGTLMYESTNDCLKYYYQDNANDSIAKWSPCILQVTDENVFKLDYIVLGRSFNGNYKEDTPMVAANTFRIAVTNEAYGTANLTFLTSDLELYGIEGITVASVSPTTSTLAAGATVEVTYTLSGTPTNCGPLIGTWRKADLEYTRFVNVVPNLIYNCAGGSWSTPVSPEHRLTGLIPGQSYTGIYSVPYSGGSTSSCDLPPEVIVRDGLLLAYAGGPVSETGTIDYILYGTYTGTTGSVTFVTSNGCTIYVGPCNSCKEILELLPGTPDGVYKIDPDKQGAAFATMDAQCDMTTDGGGWTLMANYAVSYAGQPLTLTNPGNLPANTTIRLPIIGTSKLGVSEVGNSIYFNSRPAVINAFTDTPTEFRVWGIRSTNNSTVIAETANWKVPLTAAMRTSIANNQSITFSTVPTALPGNTVTPTVWGNACCSAWGGRRTFNSNNGGTGLDVYGFWAGYLQIHRTGAANSPATTRDNAIYRVWVR